MSIPLRVAVILGAILQVSAASTARAAPAADEANVERSATPAPSEKLKPATLRIPRVGPTQPWLRYTLFTEYYEQNYDTIDSNDGFVSLVNRVNVGANTRLKKVSIASSVRFDSQNIFFPGGRDCTPGDDADCVVLDNDYRLERTTLRVDTRHVSATAGDFNVNFGRGLALSLRKIDEIGVDATIKGGRVDVRTKPIRATALGGFTNRQNSDFATRQLIPDPGYPFGCNPQLGQPPYPGAAALDDEIGNRVWTVCSDAVAGGRVEGTLPGKVDVGGHYVFLDFGDAPEDPFDDFLHLAGVDIARARIAKHWDMFLGSSVLLRNPVLRGTEFDDDAYTGYAVYTANTLGFGPTTVLLEGKHYSEYQVALTQSELLQYAEAPTLEREDQQVPGNVNSTGGRVRVDHLIRNRGLTIFGNMMTYVFAADRVDSQFCRQTRPGDDENLACQIAIHGYAGLIWRKPKSDFVTQFSAGYRQDRWRARDRMHRGFPHAEIYFSIPTTSKGRFHESLTLRGEGRYERYNTLGSSNDFFRGLFNVGYNWAPLLSMSFLLGVDTEQPTPMGEPGLNEEVCPPGEGSRCRPHFWPGFLARITLTGASFIRIFGGRQVGGRICVNGACRTVPDFEGIRAEVVLSF